MILAAGAVVAVLAVPAFEFAPGTAAAERPAKRPNVVFFLADDHTWQAISCYGSKLGATPNIDRIAAAGVRFDRCFCTESICGPSRAAIMTDNLYGRPESQATVLALKAELERLRKELGDTKD
jgi:arylsulfatase A-like enzyme